MKGLQVWILGDDVVRPGHGAHVLNQTGEVQVSPAQLKQEHKTSVENQKLKSNSARFEG